MDSHPTPLIRVVRMTFDPARLDAFLELFEEVAPRIRGYPGCLLLELWRDERYPGILTTYSHWKDETSLEAYRSSALFTATWARTRAYFIGPAVAHSYKRTRRIEPGSSD